MFIDVYNALQKSGHADPVWLTKAYADLEKDYDMWNRNPHLAVRRLVALLRFREGPPPEAVQDEGGFYRKVATYFSFIPHWRMTTFTRTCLEFEQSAGERLTRCRSAMFRIRCARGLR